jgi:peptidoglycan hydrolase CwlO-like protein
LNKPEENLGSQAWDLERVELTKRVRDLQRKVEELTDDIKLTEEANMDLKSEKSRLQLQLEELRTQLRT